MNESSEKNSPHFDHPWLAERLRTASLVLIYAENVVRKTQDTDPRYAMVHAAYADAARAFAELLRAHREAESPR